MFLLARCHVVAHVAASALADRLSSPIARWDAANLRFQDRLNALAPWGWWPIGPPAPDTPMPASAHALYVAHAYAVARVLRMPRGAVWAAGTLLSWAAFTGPWDRRAARLD